MEAFLIVEVLHECEKKSKNASCWSALLMSCPTGVGHTWEGQAQDFITTKSWGPDPTGKYISKGVWPQTCVMLGHRRLTSEQLA